MALKRCQWHIFLPATCLCSASRFSRHVAAAHVGSCCSSRSRFSRLSEEVESRGAGVAIGLGDLVEAGAVEVEGDGSKPFKRVSLNYSKFFAVKSLQCTCNMAERWELPHLWTLLNPLGGVHIFLAQQVFVGLVDPLCFGGGLIQHNQAFLCLNTEKLLIHKILFYLRGTFSCSATKILKQMLNNLINKQNCSQSGRRGSIQQQYTVYACVHVWSNTRS